MSVVDIETLLFSCWGKHQQFVDFISENFYLFSGLIDPYLNKEDKKKFISFNARFISRKIKKIKLIRPIYFGANNYIDLNRYQPLCSVLTDLIVISE